MEHDWIEGVAEYLGVDSDEIPIDDLRRYSAWLGDEAIPAGALARGERERIETRHIADSLLFARFLPMGVAVWDLGSGIGLPGIPLALLRRDQQFHLVERSDRRVTLMRRAVRILDLDNVEVIAGDLADLSPDSIDALVSRATLPPEEMKVIVDRCVRSGGVAIVGGSWVQMPTVPGWDTLHVPRDVLDHDIWVLIMRRQ